MTSPFSRPRPGRVSVLALSIALMSLASVMPSAAPRRQAAAAEPAEWTLMFYMDSDNNLEHDQMQDLAEMLRVGSTDAVNIVALVDRAASDDEDEGYTGAPVANAKAWTNGKVFHVLKGKLDELADVGEPDMGDPATLVGFATTAAKEFPAHKYGLVFGDHGASWPGACSDDSAEDDLLTLQEIGSALSTITKTTGRLEVVGFDCCLMANLEVAHTVAPFARTMIGSEEVEPGSGWSYTPLLGALTADPAMTGAEFGQTAADTFASSFARSTDEGMRDAGIGITLSAIDLDRIAALVNAVDALGDRADAAIHVKPEQSWLTIAEANSRAEEYGRSDEGGSAVFDLRSFAEEVRRKAPDAQTQAAAAAVVDAVDAAVIHAVHGKGRPDANGITIFLPADPEKLAERDQSAYADTSFAKSSRWSKFLADYTGLAATDTTAPQLEDVASSEPELSEEEQAGQPEDTITVTAKVKADDVDEATFVLAKEEGDEQIILGTVPTPVADDGTLHEEWDGGWFTIGDGKNEVICPITNVEEVEDQEDAYFVQVPAQVLQPGRRKWDDVTLYFYLDFAKEGAVTGEFVYAFEETKSGQRQYDLQEGDVVRPVFLKYDAKGEPDLVASSDPADVLKLTTAEDFVVGYTDVPEGHYLIGFAVTDYADNTDEGYVAVTLE